MKTALSIGMLTMAAACAGMGPRPQADAMFSGRWQGFLLRDGLRAPVEIQLSETSNEWSGRFSAGDNSVRLERVRVKGHDVHFELAGAGVFDGSVAGDSMARPACDPGRAGRSRSFHPTEEQAALMLV